MGYLPPGEVEAFIEYYEGRIYKIIDHRPCRVNKDDGISESDFNAYYDGYKEFLNWNKKI